DRWQLRALRMTHRRPIDLLQWRSVAPGVTERVVRLRRDDLNTDITKYSRTRALDPVGWSRKWSKSDEECQEPVWSRWRSRLEDEIGAELDRGGVDLVVVTSGPVTMLEAVRA